MANTRAIDIYLRFLNLEQTVNALPSAPKLDATEGRLLEALAASWHIGRVLTVGEAMTLSMAGAPSTVHRKLTKLKQRGLVSLDEKSSDLRAKVVVPTRLALEYFEKLGACIDEVRDGLR